MCGPAKHRLQDLSLISKGTNRAIANRIYQEMGGAGGVREIILPLIFVHPGILEVSSVLIPGQKFFSALVQNLDMVIAALQVQHIFRKLAHHGANLRLVLGILAALGIKTASLPLLQLATPKTAVVKVRSSVVIHKNSGINAKGSLNVILLRFERSHRAVTGSNADAEDPFLIPQKISGRLLYGEADRDTDLLYILDSKTVKELLILKSAEAPSALEAFFSFEGLRVKEVSEHTLQLIAPDGEPVLTLSAPQMTDAAMASSSYPDP